MEVMDEPLQHMAQERLCIVAMKGHPGSGKSTVAQSLAKALKWPLLDKDDVRHSTLTLQTLCPSSLLNDLSYDVLWRIAHTQLSAGMSVIIDCPLSRPHLFHEAAALATRFSALLLVVECRAHDSEEWKRRLEHRARDEASWHKPSTWEELQKLLEGYDGCYDYDTAPAKKLVVNTTASLDALAIHDAVLRWVSCADEGTSPVTALP